jgi:glyoxylase-like metal-dependent hydrolase (beta-lactamase superfamily II)
VIDPGGEPEVIIARMGRLNLYPSVILLTHSHFDHIAALPDLAEAFAADKPEIAIHRDDASGLGPDAYHVHKEIFTAAGGAAFVDEYWKSMPSPTRLLTEGEMAGPFKALHLPGHTPGSMGFLLEDAGILFSGDTLFHGGVGRVDLPGGSEEQLRESISRLFALDPGIIVYPGHGPATTIGAEAVLYR